MKSTRIYLTQDQTGLKRLTRATVASVAVAHHAAASIKCHIPSADELIELTKAGVEVEDAGAAPAEADKAEA